MKEKDMEMLSAVEVYQLVLSGKAYRFPLRFWEKPDADKNALEIMQYLIEEVLKMDEEHILKEISMEFFSKYRLKGMMKFVFSDSPYVAINSLYPEKFKPWQFNKTPVSYWNKDTATQSLEWLFFEKLKWSDEEIKEKFARPVFVQHGLGGMLHTIFRDSPFVALDHIFPGKFKPWELRHTPNNYWNEETTREAVRWMFEEKMKWDKTEIQTASKEVFYANQLRSVLSYYNGSYRRAILNAYPNLVFDEKSKKA